MCTGQRSGEFKGFQTHLAVGLDVHVRTGIQQLDDFGDITLLSSLLERGEAGEGVVIIDPHLSLLGVCVCVVCGLKVSGSRPGLVPWRVSGSWIVWRRLGKNEE
jgi:hypothetical protein